MHICALIDNLDIRRLAGAETSAFLVCKEFVRRGHQVSLITAGPSMSSQSALEIDGIRIHQIQARPAGLLADYALINRPKIVKDVVQIVRKLQPDIVQAHVIHNYISFGVLQSIKLAFPDLPIVVTMHDHSVLSKGALRCKGERLVNMQTHADFALPGALSCWLCQKHTFNPFKRRMLLNILNSSCDVVVFVSDALRKFFVVNGLTNRTVVIYNGTNGDLPEINQADTLAFAHRHTLENRRVVICGGRMKWLKGYHTVIDALPYMVERVGREVVLAIYGEYNEYARSLQRQAEQLGVLNQIRFLGWLDRGEIEILISLAQVGVVPSIGADALPRSVYEYMVRGLPTLATRIGGVKEIIEDGRNGFLITPWNIKEVAEKSVQVLTSPELARTVGVSARECIMSSYLVSHAAEQRINLYENLLETVA